MKKKFFILLMIISEVVFFPMSVEAHWHSGYSHTSGVEFNNSKWMDAVSDGVRLSNLSIPGTHNTMSNGPGGDIVRNQVKSLSEQLQSGIRFLDIRTRVTNGKLALHHGRVYLNVMFGSVLNKCIDFLKVNPSEVIFMRVKQEYSSVQSTEFANIIHEYIDHPSCTKYFYSGNDRSNPTLKDMRGKIVILRDFSNSSVGIHYKSQFNIQDEYHLKTNWDLYDKWLKVKTQLNLATGDYSSNKKYINYLSGSGGSFPYFVASGHSSPGTSAPRLATGLTHPGWANTYVDFPRTDWFFGIATISFEGTNVLTTNYLKYNRFKSTGIVVADFPGQGLINNIIGSNFLYTKENRILDGIYTIHPSYNTGMALDFTHTGHNATIWKTHEKNNQRFEFRYDENQQAYQIYNKYKPNLVMAWNNIGNSVKVFGHPNEHKPEHYWILEKLENNMYIFKNKKNPQLVLDVDHFGNQNGTPVKVNVRHPKEQGGAQRFILRLNN